LPGLQYPIAEFSVGFAPLDFTLHALLLIFTGCFLGDFSYYWWHRWQHKIPFLWEIHKLHHSDEHLNSTTIYRSHFLELAGQGLVRGLTIGLLFDLGSLPQTLMVIVFAELFKLVWDFFIHANVRIDALHKLLPVFTTPQFHWIHHSRLPQHRDVNFAIWLPLFDIVFGSYYHPAIDEYPPTGLSTGEKIETVWKAQSAPLVAWWGMLRGKPPAEDITDPISEV
jgi:sterol desaturase/sphingolipid hydroxylase (fatty acid hydroxylase superfamily)